MKHINTFAGSPLNRAGNERRSAAWVVAQLNDEKARFLPLWQLRALMALGDQLQISWRQRSDVQRYIDQRETLVFLGLDGDVPHFAIDVTSAGPTKAEAPFREDGKWIDVRSAAGSSSLDDAAILAQSRSMIDWHARHKFCAVCGAASEVSEAGYVRKCDACNAQHFPRTDPVVIMLVLDGDRCMLGRQAMFPKGNWSALAGFIEPGEDIEEAVAREVWEEAGIRTGAVKYIFSQPWPFPSSLMIGCWAEATTTDIHIDKKELEQAAWFSRQEVKQMIADSNGAGDIRMPGQLAIAHQLARAWIDETS